MLQKIIKINQLLILINLDLIRIKFMMIEEIGILLNQFLAFIQLADQDDNNFIEQIVRRRRRDILSRILERHRVVLMRFE
jgi:hypothetical protein